jgi:hypothetical protein
MRRWFWLGSILPFVVAVGLSQTQPQKQKEADSAEEAPFQTPPGFARQGRPAVAEGDQITTLRVIITDHDTGKPTFCRVNVVGADGNYYEPRDNALAPWSLHRLGNRVGKGPFRYYGWFFYTAGEFTVNVPAGPVRIEVHKGYEFQPVMLTARAAAGTTRELKVTLRRTVPMAAFGYYSGDTHIHLNRTTKADDERALDLIAAEDIHYGYILCMNDPREYSGVMARQIWPQTNGFGSASILNRGPYTIASGQEYRCGTYGHICLLMHKRLVQENNSVNPNNWPVFGLVGQETRQLGGYSFHAHGGYSAEIYADFAQRATDGVELLQFAEYRGIALQGWYRILNIGYRFPAVGACDFPYCRALGDSRTYVRLTGQPDAIDWVRNAAQGYSFFTTGPMLLLEVDGQPPGATLRKQGKGPHRVTARVRARCEVAPITHVDLIVNGRTVQQLVVPKAAGTGAWLELEERLDLTESSWLAARAYSTNAAGKPDAEAHTNPVYVYVNERAPYNEGDLDWLVERLDDQIQAVERREFPEKANALAFFRRSRAELQMIRRQSGQRAPDPAAGP